MISDSMPSTTGSLTGLPGPTAASTDSRIGVKRAGADVAIDDADAAERQRPEAGMARPFHGVMLRERAAVGGGDGVAHGDWT